MSEQPGDVEPTADEQAPEPEPDEPPAPKREQAFRRRAVESEARAAALQQRIDAMQTSVIVALGEERGLAQGQDVLDIGKVTLDDLRDENGDVDIDAVHEVADALLASRPGLRKQRSNGDQGKRGVLPKKASTVGWAELLRGSR